MKKIPLDVGFILLSTSITYGFVQSCAEGIVEDRMDMFEKIDTTCRLSNFKCVLKIIWSIVQFDEEICNWAVKMPKYFPEESRGKPQKHLLRSGQTFAG